VIIYGGSSVFDTRTQVDEGGSWPEKVQNILRQNGYPEVEVINAGIPGHASFDSLGRLFARDHRYGPDYVVLYNGWNDIKYFHSSRPLIHQFKPFQKGRDPRLSYQNWLDKILCRYSQLYERLRSRYYNWKLNLGKEGIKPRGDVGSIITEKSLEQFQLNLEMFLDLARNINAVPILMTQARLITPDNSESDKEKIGYGMVLLDHQSLCKAFSEVDRIIKVVAKEKDAAVIDPTDELNGNSDYFTDHVHLTPKGSGRLAELVAADLARIIVNTKKDDHSGGL